MPGTLSRRLLGSQGSVGSSSKLVAAAGFQGHEITNLKHQITNKPQISIFNDQNIHRKPIVLICKGSNNR